MVVRSLGDQENRCYYRKPHMIAYINHLLLSNVAIFSLLYIVKKDSSSLNLSQTKSKLFKCYYIIFTQWEVLSTHAVQNGLVSVWSLHVLPFCVGILWVHHVTPSGQNMCKWGGFETIHLCYPPDEHVTCPDSAQSMLGTAQSSVIMKGVNRCFPAKCST